MRKIDNETTALAIVFANTQRKKRKEDLVTIAKAFKYLVDLYGSQRAAGEQVGLSSSMVGQFLAVLKLHPEVQNLIAEREIDSVDIAKELAVLKDPAKQIAAAKAIINSQSKDVRDIKRLIKNTDIPAKDAKKLILDEKGLHVFIMDFDDEIYRGLIKIATDRKIDPADLVREIVIDWVVQKAKEEGQ
ncbi:hypothetical protein CEE36_10695 [candidate division TA06 bacterium B3_TA06]|uniref:ParB/Spo0J HTH domain-containing protein n=1 Tax=candidate division TA06 bacterium B3_TA06 TaxID=2012487 RepID=A0A532UU38_UNCT6|nr:MAG: hypothetical protein CEE36_10695 [candidate division TA06 bacterium B3_TA06]